MRVCVRVLKVCMRSERGSDAGGRAREQKEGNEGMEEGAGAPPKPTNTHERILPYKASASGVGDTALGPPRGQFRILVVRLGPGFRRQPLPGHPVDVSRSEFLRQDSLSAATTSLRAQLMSMSRNTR